MTVPQKVKLARHPADLDDDGHEYVELGVTTESDTTLRLAPDGAGGVEWGAGGSTGDFVTKIEGGQETINAIGTTGAAEDIDPTLGNVATATLGDDTAFTILEPVGSAASTLELWISTGAGGFTPTFDADGGSFVWDPTPTLPTGAGLTYRVVAERVPGTTNDWIGVLVGGGGASLSDDTPLADAGSGDSGTSPDGSRSDHVHPATSGGGLVLASDHGTPIAFDDILQASDGADFLYASE